MASSCILEILYIVKIWHLLLQGNNAQVKRKQNNHHNNYPIIIVFSENYGGFSKIETVSTSLPEHFPVDTGRKLNVLCTFNLCLVSTGFRYCHFRDWYKKMCPKIQLRNCKFTIVFKFYFCVLDALAAFKIVNNILKLLKLWFRRSSNFGGP